MGVKEKIIPCGGENCPLKITCKRFDERNRRRREGESWADTFFPCYKDGKCQIYLPMEFYGN